jgi:hypothetical protein
VDFSDTPLGQCLLAQAKNNGQWFPHDPNPGLYEEGANAFPRDTRCPGHEHDTLMGIYPAPNLLIWNGTTHKPVLSFKDADVL